MPLAESISKKLLSITCLFQHPYNINLIGNFKNLGRWQAVKTDTMQLQNLHLQTKRKE